MRVALDDGLASYRDAAGIGIYTMEIAKATQIAGEREGVPLEIVRKTYSSQLWGIVPRIVRRMAYLVTINRPLCWNDIDIVHFTSHYFPILRKKGKKYVATIQDLAAWTIPHLLPSYYVRVMRREIERAIRHADVVVTTTEWMSGELRGRFGISSERLAVVPCIARTLSDEPSCWEPNARPYFLYVGNIDRHKNVITLARAFAAVCKMTREHVELKIVGNRRKGVSEVERFVGSEGLGERVTIKGYLPDGELGAMYRRARGVILPSLYEGFGIPIIEAMANGAPVVVSDLPAFREVAGDAAMYYGQPQDEAALAEVLALLLAAPESSAAFQARGRERVRRYSADVVGLRNLRVYQALVSGRALGDS